MGDSVVESRQMVKVELDEELRRELDKIDWSRFILHGTVDIQIRDGKAGYKGIKRTYVD